MKVNVRWDIENAPPPRGTASSIVNIIKRTLVIHGYTGDVEIKAFAALEESLPSYEILDINGVVFEFAGYVRVNTADIVMKKKIEKWKAWQLTPVILLVIVGDGFYAQILEDYHMEGYNIMLVFPPKQVLGMYANQQ